MGPVFLMIYLYSTPPGCIQIPLGAGGCFSKDFILDLKVKTNVNCLDFGVNNCNINTIEIENNCNKSLFIGGIEIKPYNISNMAGKYFYLFKNVNGSYELKLHGPWNIGRFKPYIPEKDERINLSGTMDNSEVKISFLKTREMC